MPKSLRKFIRKEKARIRREVLSIKEQEKLINQLYEKIFKELKIRPIKSDKAGVGQSNETKNHET